MSPPSTDLTDVIILSYFFQICIQRKNIETGLKHPSLFHPHLSSQACLNTLTLSCILSSLVSHVTVFMLLRFTHTDTRPFSSDIIITASYFTVGIHRNYSPVVGYVGCFQFFVTTSRAELNILIAICAVWLAYMPASGIAGLCATCIFNLD